MGSAHPAAVSHQQGVMKNLRAKRPRDPFCFVKRGPPTLEIVSCYCSTGFSFLTSLVYAKDDAFATFWTILDDAWTSEPEEEEPRENDRMLMIEDGDVENYLEVVPEDEAEWETSLEAAYPSNEHEQPCEPCPKPEATLPDPEPSCPETDRRQQLLEKMDAIRRKGCPLFLGV